jgi:hypothetical protein
VYWRPLATLSDQPAIPTYLIFGRGDSTGYNINLAQRDAKLKFVCLWYAVCPAKDIGAHIISTEHKEMWKRHCQKFSVDIAESREGRR